LAVILFQGAGWVLEVEKLEEIVVGEDLEEEEDLGAAKGAKRVKERRVAGVTGIESRDRRRIGRCSNGGMAALGGCVFYKVRSNGSCLFALRLSKGFREMG
jgi:hypothetical protein